MSEFEIVVAVVVLATLAFLFWVVVQLRRAVERLGIMLVGRYERLLHLSRAIGKAFATGGLSLLFRGREMPERPSHLERVVEAPRKPGTVLATAGFSLLISRRDSAPERESAPRGGLR